MDRKKIHRNARRNHTRIEIDISHNILRATSSPPLLTLLLLLLLLCSSLSLSSGRWVAAGVFCDMWDLRRRMIDSPSRFAFFLSFLFFTLPGYLSVALLFTGAHSTPSLEAIFVICVLNPTFYRQSFHSNFSLLMPSAVVALRHAFLTDTFPISHSACQRFIKKEKKMK